MGNNEDLWVIKHIQQGSGAPTHLLENISINICLRTFFRVTSSSSSPPPGRRRSTRTELKVKGRRDVETCDVPSRRGRRGFCQSQRIVILLQPDGTCDPITPSGALLTRQSRRSNLLIIIKQRSHDSSALSRLYKPLLCACAPPLSLS